MIQPNEDILAEDFINESEADPTPANDEGRVAKLESDGKISPRFLKDVSAEVLTGEAIDASAIPKAVFIHNGDESENAIINQSNGYAGQFTIWGSRRRSQVFTNTEYDFISSVYWECAGGSGLGVDDSLFVEIFAVDVSNIPTGSALASKQFTNTAFDSGGSICVFDTPAPVSRNTKYAVVLRGSTSDSGDYYTFDYSNDNPSSIFPSSIKVYDGSVWSDAGGIYARNIRVSGYQDLESGKLYKSDKDYPQRNKFDGFVYGRSYSADELAYLYNNFITNFSGLTPVDYYFIENDGDILNTGSVVVGRAANATSLRILKQVASNSAQLLWNYSSDSNVNNVTYTITEYGFVFGTLNSTDSGADALITWNGFNGGTLTIKSEGNSDNVPFCIPVCPGDTLVVDGSDMTSTAYFRKLSA